MLLHEEIGRNDHREGAPHVKIFFYITCNFIFFLNRTHILTVFWSNTLVPGFITFTLLPSGIATRTFWPIVFFLNHFIVFVL